MKNKQTKSKAKTLSTTLYCYVEGANARHAKTEGKKLFGSFSAYVNALIARDRGVTPSLGIWKAKGESTAERLAKKGKPAKKKSRPAPGKTGKGAGATSARA